MATNTTTNTVEPPEPQQAESSNYDAAQGDSSNYDATTTEVSNDATVQGRMEGLLSEGSKYMKAAESKANELSNKRGILNSTMGVGAAQKANIEAALPIAQQDANTYDVRERTNQAAENTADQFNASQDQQMELANMDSENQAGQFNASQDQQNSQFNAQQANDMLQQNWSQQSAQAHEEIMSNLEYMNQKGLIDAKAYANLRGQYLDSFTSVINESNINISEIQSNANIPADQKQKMIENQIKMRDADLTAMKSLFQSMPMWQQNWLNA